MWLQNRPTSVSVNLRFCVSLFAELSCARIHVIRSALSKHINSNQSVDFMVLFHSKPYLDFPSEGVHLGTDFGEQTVMVADEDFGNFHHKHTFHLEKIDMV